MAIQSQAERPIRVKTALGESALVLRGFQGEEALSRPFLLTLDLLSEDEKIDGAALLRTAVTVTTETAAGEQVHTHGLIRRFVQLGQHDNFTMYRAEVVPWLWFLSLSRDCRIFQHMSALEIVEKVFKDLGFSDFRVNCSRTLPAREYCVQYRESDLNFVSRLLEEEGLYYYFEHTAEKHTLMISDQSSLAEACDGGGTDISRTRTAAGDIITHLEADCSVHIGEVELRDFDFEQPAAPVASSISGKGKEHFYDYHPGRFTTMDRGDALARLELEAAEATRSVVRGQGTCRVFRAGYSFTLRGHYRADANTSYLITEVHHQSASGDWRSGMEEGLDYQNRFVAIPLDVPYRPPRRASRPVITGTQTAKVVGKSGEEIWVDRYGRVKVKFHWDRSEANDEGASCWVRVSSTWAGRQWGAIQLPRVGEEVVVGFLEGDPDQPIIIGRVYNADQMPPWDLPENKTQSGVKSRSSPGGTAKSFNEIRMEDLEDSEELYIHAEKDHIIVVENDRIDTVGNDETLVVKHDRSETVENDATIAVGENRTETVGSNESISIGGNRTETVDGDESVTVSGRRGVKVAGADSLKVSGDRSVSVDAKLSVDAKGGVVITSPKSIEFKVGANSVKIEASGIKVNGMQVEITGTATAVMKSKATTVEGQVTAELKGKITSVTGDAMLKARGGITMIN
jgi:type VI secretion system secreted protein VgrG